MNCSHYTLHVSLILILVALLFFLSSVEQAKSAGGYELTWSTVDGGGAQNLSDGGLYTLSGTAGQPDAGMQSDGSYTLAGGFWVDLFGVRVYLPLILK
jgi:hypothetical protein